MSAHTSEKTGQSRFSASPIKARSRLRTASSLRSANLESWLEQRRRYLPTLVLAALCWLMVAYILTTVPPERIAHFPLPNSYSPLLIPLLLGLFLLSSVMFLNRRRAYLVTIWVGILLFLKLQLITITPIIVASLTGVILSFEVIRSLVKKTRSV